MRHIAIMALTIAVGCKPAAERRADSPTVQPVDTLKPVAATDTLPSRPADSTATKSMAPATKSPTKSTKLGRDSAFGPPRNLPKLDTVATKRPPG